MSSGEAESAAPIATTEAAANDVAQILKGIQRMQKELCSVCQEQEELMLQIKRNARNESTFRVETTSTCSKELLDWPVKDLHKGGVFTVRALPLLSNLEDPELRRLAQALPVTVLSSRADNTTKKYLCAYQQWKTWANARQGVPSIPVQKIHLVLYIQHLK
ncbi:hypothetical protein EMCRGX_G020589 [Ephydatia muelleri]